MMAEKDALRRELRRRRQAFVAERGDATFPPAQLLARLKPRLQRGIRIASYRAIGGEPDMSAVDTALAASGASILYPRVDDGAMRFHAAGAMERHSLGFEQPRGLDEAQAPSIVLVPLVGFDRNGGRLGQGGGYYDRALTALHGIWTIGVAWSVQELRAVPREPWDIGLDAIVTEKKWIEP